MDRYTLKIVTLANHSIKEKINLIKDPKRLTTICNDGDINDVDSYHAADIIILSYAQAVQHIDDILQNKAEYTKIILLTDETLDEKVNEQLLEYDLWEPTSITLLHHIFALKEKMLINFDLELVRNQLYTLIDSVPDLIWYKDLQGGHIDVNEPFCHSIGKTKQDIKKEIKYFNQGEIMGLTPEEFANFACVATDNFVIKNQKTSLFDEKVLIHNEMRQFKTYKTALRGRNGETIGTVGMAHDVTDIWNTHEEFRIVISRLPFSMIILDKNYELLSYNSEFEALFDYNEEKQATFDIESFGKKYFDYDISLREVGNTTIEKEMINKGEVFYFIIEKSEISDVFGEISGYFYIFRDITKTRQYEEKLRLIAETDELTQINNRKAIREFYERKLPILVQGNISFAIAIIDIDYFKLYNDHYGHLEGDMVIKSIANILRGRSDNEKVFVARFGGEEFLLISINQSQNQVLELINSLMQDLKQLQIPHAKSKVDKVLTMSMGVQYLPKLSSNMQLVDLIELADEHLYEAKNQGRNCFVSNIKVE